jgi:hypothetical protein
MALFAAMILTTCASQAPVVMRPPSVEVTQLKSTLITPQIVKFEAKIVIQNNSNATMGYEGVDYAVDLFENELFTESFNRLNRTRSGQSNTVTFPFQIAMQDILDQAVDLLAEGSLKVTFRGEVFPDRSLGFAAVPFEDTISIPIPEIPEVTLLGTEGVPFSEVFRLRFNVKNTNVFAISIDTVDSFIEINKKKYELLHSIEAKDIEPEESEVLELQMENTPGKTLSMVLNILGSGDKTKFNVGGEIICNTPYGWIYIPLSTEGLLE